MLHQEILEKLQERTWLGDGFGHCVGFLEDCGCGHGCQL